MCFRFLHRVILWIALVGLGSLAGCGDGSLKKQDAAAKPAGSAETNVKAPLENHLHCPLAFVGVHLRKEMPADAVNAFHYCAELNDELTQCILYDGKGPKARLIGIEYLVPGEVYEAMPEEEKQYWHHHRYEVDDQLLKSLTQSGQEEKETLAVVRTLYGKIYHTWVEGDKYPVGPAKLFFAVYGEEPFVLPEGFRLPEEIMATRHKED